MEIPQNVKNIFSRRALAALNACARFCYNMCRGWGIALKKGDGYVAIGIDQQQLLKWLKDENFPTACPDAVPSDTPAGSEASVKQALAGRAPVAVEQVFMDGNGDADDETTPANIDSTIARIGTSAFAARADHKHRDPVIHQTRQTLDTMFTVDGPDADLVCTLKFYPPKFDCGGRYIGLDDTAVEVCKFYAVAD